MSDAQREPDDAPGESLPAAEGLLQSLRRAIADAEYDPGAKLVERELCARYGVGRTAVRGALRHLAAEGIVELTENRGARVRLLTYADAQDLYQIRAVLEGLAGELFAIRGTAAQKRAFAVAIDDVRLAFDGDDIVTTLAVNEAFYDHMLHGSGNVELRRTIDRLHVRINQLRRLSLSSPNRSRSTLAELERIVDAVLAGDAERARQACVDHVRAAASVALPMLATQD